MESKTLCATIARSLDWEPEKAAQMLESFAMLLRDRASNLDSIAIPSFGNFVSLKLPERIAIDSQTGQRMLMPPQIKLEFVASARLKKQISSPQTDQDE